MDKYIGKRLDGRYEIHELIGVGGMANVYRCNDTVDDREVAIKILKDEYLNNEEFIRRFKNESKAIAMLSHPNIVKASLSRSISTVRVSSSGRTCCTSPPRSSRRCSTRMSAASFTATSSRRTSCCCRTAPSR